MGGVLAGDIDEDVDDVGERGGEDEGEAKGLSEGMAGTPGDIQFLQKPYMSREKRTALVHEQSWDEITQPVGVTRLDLV